MNFVRRIKKNVTVTLNGVVRAIIHYGGSHSGADDSRYFSETSLKKEAASASKTLIHTYKS